MESLCLGKLFSTVFHDRLEEKLQSKIVISQAQADFVKISEQQVLFTHVLVLLKNTLRRVNIHTPHLSVFEKHLILSGEKI